MTYYTGQEPVLSVGDTTKIVLQTGIDLTGNTALKIYLYTLAAFQAGQAKLADLTASVQGDAADGLIEASLQAGTFPTAGVYVARSYAEWGNGQEKVLGAPVQFPVTRGLTA